MSQFFEHLNLYDGVRLLDDCYRVLRTGGKMRISVPDAWLLIDTALSGNMDKFRSSQPEIYSQIYNQMTKLSLLLFGSLHEHGDSGHKMMWTPAGLREILLEHGFKDMITLEFNPRFDAPVAENHQFAMECGK